MSAVQPAVLYKYCFMCVQLACYIHPCMCVWECGLACGWGFVLCVYVYVRACVVDVYDVCADFTSELVAQPHLLLPLLRRLFRDGVSSPLSSLTLAAVSAAPLTSLTLSGSASATALST